MNDFADAFNASVQPIRFVVPMKTVFRFSERVVPYGMTGRTDNPKQRSHRCCSALLSQTSTGRRFLPVGMVANGVQISGIIIVGKCRDGVITHRGEQQVPRAFTAATSRNIDGGFLVWCHWVAGNDSRRTFFRNFPYEPVAGGPNQPFPKI